MKTTKSITTKNRLISMILCVIMLIGSMPMTVRASVERFPYAIFAASSASDAIISTANNFVVNGGIATNGTFTFNNLPNGGGVRHENVGESMIRISRRIGDTYFSDNSVERHDSDYSSSNQILTIRNPIVAGGSIELTGNIDLHSSLMARGDIVLNGELINQNSNIVIYSEQGDIIINNHNNVNLGGNTLLYAPNGNVVITSNNVGVRGVIIAQTVSFNSPNVNIDYRTAVADFVGITSEASEPPKFLPSCGFGGTIVPPITTGNAMIRIVNGNGLAGNNVNRRVLNIDVLELILGTAIKANDIYGFEIVTWGARDDNRQVFIDVNGVSSPMFHGSSTPIADRINAIMSNGNISPRTEQNFLRYMNKYDGNPKAADDIVEITPFVTIENPSEFNVTVRANNDHLAVVVSVTLLGADGETLGFLTYSSLDDNGEWGQFVSFIECGECIDCVDLRTLEFERVIALNEDAYFSVEILFDSKGSVYSIDGQFSEVLVTDDVSALQALNDVQRLLEIENPFIELIHHDTFTNRVVGYNAYLFRQVYNEISVMGRYVTVVAKNDGQTLSLDSSFLSISNVNIIPNITAESVMSEFGVDNAELVIFSFDEFQDEPVLAYLVSTWDEELLVSADNGEVIEKGSTELEDNVVVATENITTFRGQGRNDEILTCQSGRRIFVGRRNNHNMGDWDNGASVDDFLRRWLNIIDIIDVVNVPVMQRTHNRDIYHYEQTFNIGNVPLRVYARKMIVSVNRGVENADGNLEDLVLFNPDTNREEDRIRVGEIISIHSNLISDMELRMPFRRVTFNNILPASVVAENVEVVLPNARLVEVISNPNVIVDTIRPVIHTWNLRWDDCECSIKPVENNIENEPRIVYVFLDIQRGSTYYVCAITGEVLNRCDGCGFGHPLGKGLDAGRFELVGDRYVAIPMQLQYFPITRAESGAFQMSTTRQCVVACITNNCEVRNGRIQARELNDDGNRPSINVIESVTSFFNNPESVSAYLNAIRACEWFVKSFGKHKFTRSENLDLNITESDLIFIVGSFTASDERRNQAYAGVTHVRFTEPYDQPYSSAVNFGTFVHEFQHGVHINKNHTSTDNRTNYAIFEGYADVFAHFATYNDTARNNWVRRTSCAGADAPSNRTGRYIPTFNIDFNSSSISSSRRPHAYIPFIVHPVWIMHGREMVVDGVVTREDDGIDIKLLQELYYSSLDKGTYTRNATMNSVRTNVIKAARAMWQSKNEDIRLTSTQVQTILSAFGEMRAWDTSQNLYIMGVDAEQNWIAIHNPGENVLAMDGMYLSNDRDNLAMWRIPRIIVRPGTIILIGGVDNVDEDLPKRANAIFNFVSGSIVFLVRRIGDDITIISTFTII
jgi:hypothetical protein